MRRLLLALLAAVTLAEACGQRHHARGPDPTIDGVTPLSGPRTGGGIVTIRGAGFGAHPFVTFGHSDVTSFGAASDTALSFVAPADVVGPANVTVITAAGGRRTLLDAYFDLPLAPIAFGTAGTAVAVSGTAAIGGIDLALPAAPTGGISGMLVDSAGTPLIGHDVIAVRVDLAYAPVRWPAGVDGRFELDGLPAGAWRMTSDEPADSDLAGAVLGSAFDVEPGAIIAGADFPLAGGGTIDGTLTAADGTPLAGIPVYASVDAPLPPRFDVTDAGGAFAIHGLAPGPHTLFAVAAPAGHVSEYFPGTPDPTAALAIDVADGAIADGSMILDSAGAIAGQLTEQSGGAPPLSDVAIVAVDRQRGLEFDASSGADGRFQLGGLPAGSYRVGAAELGLYYAGVTTTAAATPVIVSAGATASNVNFLGRLGAQSTCADPSGTGSIGGRVLDPGGVPVLRAIAILSTTTGGEVARTESGADGGWTAGCLAPGDYSLRLVAPGRALLASTSGPITAAAGATTPSGDVTLARGATLAGIVQDLNDLPIADAPVRLLGPAGEVATVRTSPDGSWVLDATDQGGLGPGTWTVTAGPTLELDAGP